MVAKAIAVIASSPEKAEAEHNEFIQERRQRLILYTDVSSLHL